MNLYEVELEMDAGSRVTLDVYAPNGDDAGDEGIALAEEEAVENGMEGPRASVARVTLKQRGPRGSRPVKPRIGELHSCDEDIMNPRGGDR